jgi:hypothetical protein
MATMRNHAGVALASTLFAFAAASPALATLIGDEITVSMVWENCSWCPETIFDGTATVDATATEFRANWFSIDFHADNTFTVAFEPYDGA